MTTISGSVLNIVCILGDEGGFTGGGRVALIAESVRGIFDARVK